MYKDGAHFDHCSNLINSYIFKHRRCLLNVIENKSVIQCAQNSHMLPYQIIL